jgi:hypothetical protein
MENVSIMPKRFGWENNQMKDFEYETSYPAKKSANIKMDPFIFIVISDTHFNKFQSTRISIY